MAKTLTESIKFITGEGRDIDDLDRKVLKKITIPTMINFEPSKKVGKITPSKGITKIYQLAEKTSIQNIKFSKDNTGITKLIGVSGGNIYNITGWTGTTSSNKITAGLHKTNFVDIIPCTKKDILAGTIENFLTLLDGYNYPQKYDYSTVSTLTTSHKASFGKFINESLHTNDIAEPALWRYSSAYTPEDFETTSPSTGGFKLLGDNSNPLTAVSSIFIPTDNNSHIILAKKNQIWGISGTSSTNFQQYLINENEVGTKSKRGLISLGQEILILGDDDIYRYTTLTQQGIINTKKSISDPIREIYKNKINTEYIHNSFMFFDNKENNTGRIYSFIPTALEFINEAFVYDRQGGWFRRNFNANYFTCIDKDPDSGLLYAGDSFGNIFLLNDGYDYNGENYECFLDFGFMDFGTGFTKTGTANNFLEIDTKEDINITLNLLKLGKDGGIYGQNEITLPFKRKKYQYDTSKFNQAIFSESTRARQEFETGVFNKIKIQMKLEKAQDFIINELNLESELAFI